MDRTLATMVLVAGFAASILAPAQAQDPKNPAPNPPNPALSSLTQPGVPGTPGAPGAPGVQPPTGAPGLPGTRPASGPLPPITTDDPDMVTLAAFAEPVSVSSLVDLLAATLNINVIVKGDIPGTVTFNAPMAVRKERLLPLVDALLEQHGFTIVLDKSGFYSVRPRGEVQVNFADGSEATTKVFRLPNIRPSALQQAIQTQLSAISGQAGAGPKAMSAIDESGILVVTDTPRSLEAIESLINKVLEEYNKSEYLTVDLKHISAPVARERALQLVGQLAQPLASSAAANPNIAGQQPVPGAAGGSRTSLDNLGDRLTVSPQGNALIFRGVPEEIVQVRRVLEIIDRPTGLAPKRYEVGAAASQIADVARQRGLGEVTTIADRTNNAGFENAFNNTGLNPSGFAVPGARGSAITGGSVMVVDETRGSILYYGTEEQHQQMQTLIGELDIQAEQVVIRTYKIQHSDAEELADLINGLLTGALPVAQSELLPGGDGGGQSRRSFTPRTNQPNRNSRTTPGQTPEGELTLDGENALVYGFKKQSLLLVKAPLGQQENFRALIEKLDVRRPQVYVEAKIVTVTWTDEMRLAFESQLINANGRGGVFQSNFGLSSPPTGGSITDPRVPSTGLVGLTAAVLRSDQLPIVMNALQRDASGRVLSTPALLVDDNEEAEIVSLDQQPTTQISRGTGGSGDIVTPGDYIEAGTKLNITPQISTGGYLRLKYEVELSSFTGRSTTLTGGGVLPPPKQTNTVKSDSVTVPSDSTVVVGGLEVDSKTKTIAKVPLLGDIPLVGLLFQDRNTGDQKTTVYIFLTPRIMRDPNFFDLRINTEGPQARVKLPSDGPSLRPSAIDVREPVRQAPIVTPQPNQPTTRPRRSDDE